MNVLFSNAISVFFCTSYSGNYALVVFGPEKTLSYYSTFLDGSSIANPPLFRRNYSLAGVRTLVEWISSVHAPLEGSQTLLSHPRIMEFLKLMENKLARGRSTKSH
jgi:hypothetical protein